MGRNAAASLQLLAVFVAGMALVHAVRKPLFEQERQVKNRHDVYFLPPPQQVVTMSVGYRYALADVLWAHVLVSQGLHTQERRRFENLNQLYDAIYALDPDWRTPYLLADALLSFQSSKMPYEDVIKVREILERGVARRPYDAELWLNLGQFVSFIAPASYLEPDRPELAAKWRVEGTEFLARAAELSGGDSRLAWQALGGASILKKEGDTTAALRFLKQTYTLTTDEELKRQIEAQIQSLQAASDEVDLAIGRMQLEEMKAREQAFRALVREEMRFITRTKALLLGPRPRPAACAGGAVDEPDCATTWRQWADRFDEQRRMEREGRRPVVTPPEEAK